MIVALPHAVSRFYPHLTGMHRFLLRQWTQLDRAVDKRTMSESEFARLLDRLGVTSGATILVFSSMERLSRRVPGLKPLVLVQLLQQRLGPEGTLLMPAFSFRGRQRDFADQNDTFDVWKTPARAGILPEVFRRMPDVIRSLHPTHSIAGWGRHAAELLATHHLGTAFGPNSPMYKLQHYGGLVVGLGTRPAETFTIIHVSEELHPATRVWAYEERLRVMTISDGTQRIPYQLSVLRADVERDRFELSVLKALIREGVVKSMVERGLLCCVTPAGQVIERAFELIDGFGRAVPFARTEVESTPGS